MSNVEQVMVNIIGKPEGNKIKILKEVSGIIKPSRYRLKLIIRNERHTLYEKKLLTF